ncbi:KH domain-containing protein At4g18375-like [Cornus florida]|uniref:KH domain-containing protein At4g18375-like n=1 Tax=Cornus florida TaxID=4283 RepID=UPI0028972C3C|nr:KH domain-containing protein At4g18375-like [Cornus florida]
MVQPPTGEDTYRTAAAKRPRDEGDAAAASGGTGIGAPSPKRQAKSTQDVLFRIVVPSRQIGKVIGKVGSRIQRIREETKATIKIADAVSRHEERVIIISSKDSDKRTSDAENALHQIASLVLKDDVGNIEPLNVGAGHMAANTIRLLIAGSQAGSLIGISGQNIEKLRNFSGAIITVLAQHQLPFCASAHESDRVVQISGDVPAVLKALSEIGYQLRDNPPNQVISINPTYNLGFNRPPQQYVDPNSADYVTLEMLISETLVGGLIGRCGSNISRIRSESGATIKVHGGKGEQKERQIHLGGSAQQVSLAKQRIDEYIHSQLVQQAGTHQSIDSKDTTDLAPIFTSTAAQQVPAYPRQQVPAYPREQVPAYPSQRFPVYPPQQFPAYPTQQFPAYPTQEVHACQGLSFHAPPM